MATAKKATLPAGKRVSKLVTPKPPMAKKGGMMAKGAKMMKKGM